MDGAQPKDAAPVRILPPLVPLGTLLLGIVLDSIWPLDLGVEVSATTRYWIGGTISLAAFVGLGLWPELLFRRTGQDGKPWTSTREIVDRGPFRLTRNPIYLMMILICIGFAVVLMNAWIVLLTPACGWILQRFAIVPEEAYLEQKFGDVYLAYKKRVRRWI